MFDWDDARYFLAIHRTGTLSAASRRLGVNQSTVGRRLETLEESLGVRLFLRTRDGYSISPAGEQLVPRAERMEDEADAIARELVGQQARLSGSVRVTTSPAFGPRVIAPILAEFLALHPAIDLELDADNRMFSLTKREADMAIRFARPPDRHLVASKLAGFGNAVYCAPSYVDKRGRPRPPFEGHDFIAEYPEATPEARWVAQHAAKGRVVFKSSSTHVHLVMTLAGLGIALLPCYLGDREPGLVRLCPPLPAVQRAVWLVMHRDLQYAPRIRACADFLAERIRARNDWLTGHERPRAAR
jgi:DNA-binding transcriptional LysR family regulator